MSKDQQRWDLIVSLLLGISLSSFYLNEDDPSLNAKSQCSQRRKGYGPGSSGVSAIGTVGFV
jgi:hypothetical protein